MGNTYAFSNYINVNGLNTIIGKGAGNAAMVNGGNTIIGQGAGTSVSTATYNTIIGNGANALGGQTTIIGNRAVSSATSAAANVILIGTDAKASTNITNACMIGGQTNNTFITDYGRGHMLYMPLVTYTASATITAADVLGGVVLFNLTTSATCTFPTQAQIFAAMKDPIVGSGFRLLLCKHGAGALSFTMGGITQLRAFSNAVLTGNAMYFHYVVDNVVTPTFKIRGSYCTGN